MKQGLWIACLGLAMCACACASGPSANPSRAPLELSLTRVDGRTLQLSALRGHALVLFLFTTYDETSQFALIPITRYLETDSDAQVLGVAVQPDAKTFLTLFARSLSVPFELYYDTNNQLLSGQTVMGRLHGVPAFVALDADGKIRDSYYGVPSVEQLRELTASARGH
jgi:peroxiredoxin